MLSHTRRYFDLKRLLVAASLAAWTGEVPRLPGHDHREDQEQDVPCDESGHSLERAGASHEIVVPQGEDDLRQGREDAADQGPDDRPAQRRPRVVVSSADE